MLKATRSYPRVAGRATGVETSGVERLLPKSQQLEPASSTKGTHGAGVGS